MNVPKLKSKPTSKNVDVIFYNGLKVLKENPMVHMKFLKINLGFFK
jgi:hypothetical protein